MLDPKILDDLSSKLSALLAASPAADMEKNARAVLTAFFGKLDLVSRQDFEVQAELLARARARLQDLEQRITALEARSGSN
jgi:BMFP domain-containing protein YqiC